MDECSDANPGEALLAAAVKAEITPTDLRGLNPIGGGDFTAVHDPLWLRALILADGSSTVALVTTDLIEVGDMRAIREQLAADLDIPADHIVITASHTHSAPRLGRVSRGALAHGGGGESDRFSAVVYAAMSDALRRAQEMLKPATVEYAVGHVDVNVNRDAFVDGRWTLGHNEAGPSDKSLRLVTVRDGSGCVLATVLNYAVHSVATLGSGLVSGDIAGAASRYVEERLEPGAVALWTVGSLGDQNPRVRLAFPGTHSPEEVERAFAASDAQGLLIGAEAIRVLADRRPASASVRVWAREVAVDLPTNQAAAVMDSMQQQRSDTVELLLCVIGIGEIVLAGVSAEVTASVAERLRTSSPHAAMLLVSMANDRIGYLPGDSDYLLPTFEANGSPIARGFGASAAINGLVDLMHDYGR